MKKYNIEKAVLMPNNAKSLYCETANKTNKHHYNIVNEYPDKFLAFADITMSGSSFLVESPQTLERAVKKYNLKGLKIHPNNLNLDMDDLRLIPVLRKAAELQIPVMVHSNPNRGGFNDNCAPDKINKIIKVFPDLDFITAHMGGMKFMDAISGCTYVDISYILPVFVKMYGIEQANRILRMFGSNRLIFGTDYPEGDVEEYITILNQMDFTDEEIERIAYKNIEKILQLN